MNKMYPGALTRPGFPNRKASECFLCRANGLCNENSGGFLTLGMRSRLNNSSTFLDGRQALLVEPGSRGTQEHPE
jgi:hypothetical protein